MQATRPVINRSSGAPDRAPHPTRRRNRRIVASALVTCLLVASCASGDDEAGDTTPPPEPTTEVTPTTVPPPPAGEGWLAAARIAEPAATELDVLHIEGIDPNAELDTLELLLLTESETASLPIYLDDGELTAIAPLHPSAPGDGGPIELQFADGDSRSDVIVITLDGVPSADGAFADTVDALTSAIDASAVALGSSFAELSATDIDDVADELRSLKLMQGYVDDGTDHDLESLADQLDDDDRALLDALVAKLGLIDAIGGPSTAAPIGFRSAEPSARTPIGAAVRPAPAWQSGGDCTPGNVEADTADQLIAAMEKGTDAIIRDAGAEAQVLAGIQSLGAVIGQLPLGAYGEIMGVIVDMFSLIETYKNSVSGQYPTMFESIEAQVTTTEFNEDFTEDGRVEQVTLVAASTGWDASALVATATKAVTGALSGKLTGRLKDGVADDTAKEVIDLGGKLRDSATGQYIDAVTAGNYSVCKQQFPVTISDTKYLVLEASSIGNMSADDASLTYKPLKIGPDRLRIRADATVFANRTIELEIPVETKQLRVIANPEEIRVQRPGEEKSVTVRLENADTTTLAWLSGPGSWADGTGDDTNDAGTRVYKTPSNPNDYPYVMEIRSTSTTGLRATATDFRNDTVTFRLTELVIEPNPGEVQVRKAIEFVSMDRDGNEVEARWQATGGEITPGPTSRATYVAGDEPGEYEVTATLATNSAVSASVPVFVGEFCLQGSWRLNADHFAQLVSESGTSVTAAGGSWDLTVDADGGFSSVLNGFALKFDSGGTSGTIIINGAQTGTVNATATSIQSVNTTSRSLSVTVQTPQGSFDASPDDLGVGTDLSGGPYYCEGGQLIVKSDGYDIIYDRLD